MSRRPRSAGAQGASRVPGQGARDPARTDRGCGLPRHRHRGDGGLPPGVRARPLRQPRGADRGRRERAVCSPSKASTTYSWRCRQAAKPTPRRSTRVSWGSRSSRNPSTWRRAAGAGSGRGPPNCTWAWRTASEHRPRRIPRCASGAFARCATAVESAGLAVEDDTQLDGHDRWYVRDPFGNRLELIEAVAGLDGAAVPSHRSGRRVAGGTPSGRRRTGPPRERRCRGARRGSGR